ncbi:hypothetical protein HPT27_01200 [Permianibacter sp. IMCC34836]|uniref:hypothetical protein n=1 Tax=Permianibacter fluminis TaxID=2738515 RepID=UPI001555EF09|nr:hypothetical protein [Permianibacter fluminis]NQD35618.1 hypothetical protein [Permianibacter fluminis]
MHLFRKVVSIVFVVFAVSSISYCAYSYGTAETRVKELCGEIKPGMSISELRAFGLAKGLGPEPHNESGVNFMVERKTYGRYGCKIVIESGVVKGAQYDFAD